MPALTVIVPTYRRPTLLRRALASVLAQTFRDLIVIVYDNASADETDQVVSEFAARDQRVAYVRRVRNVGAAENFARALDDVATDYFAFLSDDDALFPRCYELCMRGFAQAPDVMLSAGSTLEVDALDDVRYAPLGLWPRDGVFQPPESLLAMLDNRHPTWTAVVFKRAAIVAVGGLDLAVGPPSDLDLELRIAARFPISITKTPCAVFYAHADSNTSRQDAAVADGMHVMAEKFARDAIVPLKIRSAVAPRLARQVRLKLFEIVVKALVRGDDDVARACIRRLSADPRAHLLATVGRALAFVCEHIPGCRGLLQAAERARVSARAARAKTAVRGYDIARELLDLKSLASDAKASPRT